MNVFLSALPSSSTSWLPLAWGCTPGRRSGIEGKRIRARDTGWEWLEYQLKAEINRIELEKWW